MEDYLNFKISKLRKVTVIEIKNIPVFIPKRNITLNKITFFVKDSGGRDFQISDVWLDKAGTKIIKGLFLTLTAPDKISSGCSLGKLLSYYNKNQLKDFIGNQVIVYPDKKDFLVLVACELGIGDQNAM